MWNEHHVLDLFERQPRIRGLSRERCRRILWTLQGESIVARRIHVLRRTDVGAFVAPGQNIYVTSGLLELCKNDEQLAFVIAHELAHLLLGHVPQKFGVADLIRLRCVGGHARELSADRKAISLCATVGFDPRRCADAMSILRHRAAFVPDGNQVAVDGASSDGSFIDRLHIKLQLRIASHPSIRSREEALAEWIEKHERPPTPAPYRSAPDVRHRVECVSCTRDSSRSCDSCLAPLCRDHARRGREYCPTCRVDMSTFCTRCKARRSCSRCSAKLRCSVCARPSNTACTRCRRPFCKRHAPDKGGCCGPCESVYARRRTRARALPFLAAALVVVLGTPVFAFLPSAAAAAVAAFGLWCSRGFIDGMRRRRFLAERVAVRDTRQQPNETERTGHATQ